MQRLSGVAPDAVCTSIVVACELRFGAQRKGSAVLTERVNALLDAMADLPPVDFATVKPSDLRAATVPMQVGPPPVNADSLWQKLFQETFGTEPPMGRLEFSVACNRSIMLRHTAASRMVNRGASFKDVADVLGVTLQPQPSASGGAPAPPAPPP